MESNKAREQLDGDNPIREAKRVEESRLDLTYKNPSAVTRFLHSAPRIKSGALRSE